MRGRRMKGRRRLRVRFEDRFGHHVLGFRIAKREFGGLGGGVMLICVFFFFIVDIAGGVYGVLNRFLKFEGTSDGWRWLGGE